MSLRPPLTSFVGVQRKCTNNSQGNYTRAFSVSLKLCEEKEHLTTFYSNTALGVEHLPTRGRIKNALLVLLITTARQARAF